MLNLANDFSIRHHCNDDIAIASDFGKRGSKAPTMSGNKFRTLRRIDIVYLHAVACLEQIGGHRFAHVADADKADVCSFG